MVNFVKGRWGEGGGNDIYIPVLIYNYIEYLCPSFRLVFVLKIILFGFLCSYFIDGN